MKEEIAQQNLDIFSDCSLAEISFALFFEKEFIAGLKKRQKSQDELLKKTAVLLKEIKDILFEMQQGELFDDDSTETFEQLREIIGEEQAGEVAKAFAGTMLYIPKNVIARNLHKRIKKEFLNGATYKELGRKYGYTERYIRDLVDRKKERQDGKA